MSKKITSKTNASANASVATEESIVEVVTTPVATEAVVAPVAQAVVAPVVVRPVAVVTSYEKTFSVAGISNLNGVYKARFANSTNRTKVLRNNGHVDIRLIELPYPMTKRDAVLYLMDLPNCKEASDALKVLFTDLCAVQAFDDLLNGTVPRRVHPVSNVTATVTSAIAQALTGTINSDNEAPMASFDDAEFAEA